jgi:ribonuclease HI
MSTEESIIHCDGSYDSSSKLGAYGIVLQIKSKVVELSGVELCDTSTRAELLAAVTAFRHLRGKVYCVKVFSDSRYLIDGISTHVFTWKAEAWQTSARKLVSNKDLWLELLGFSKRYSIDWNWIRGHAGNTLNERADSLAREALISHRMESQCGNH